MEIVGDGARLWDQELSLRQRTQPSIRSFSAAPSEIRRVGLRDLRSDSHALRPSSCPSSTVPQEGGGATCFKRPRRPSRVYVTSTHPHS